MSAPRLAGACLAPAEIVAARLSARFSRSGVDRLHQIVDRLDFEGGDRELVEGGDEHDRGRRVPASRARGRRRCRRGPASRCRAAADRATARRPCGPRLRRRWRLPTRSTSGHCASSSCSRSAASGSSSAIRSLSGCSSIGTVQRQCHQHTITTVGRRAKFAFRSAAEARLEPLADVREADAGAVGLAVALLLARPCAAVR